MIDAYVGVPGSGKSYMLVRRGLEALAKGRDVYANFAFIPENVYLYLRKRHRMKHPDAVRLADSTREIRSYAQLIDITRGLLLFDEAHGWIPSTRGQRLIPFEVVSFWSQHRKVGVDVILATQRFGSVDVAVRELVANCWLARPAPWTATIPMRLRGDRRPVIRYTEIMDDATGEISKKAKGLLEAAVKNEVTVLDPVVARCYDTKAIFEPPIVALERELDSKSRQVAEAMGMRWDAERYRGLGSERARDGAPALSIRELHRLMRSGERPHEALSRLMRESASADRAEPRSAVLVN